MKILKINVNVNHTKKFKLCFLYKNKQTNKEKKKWYSGMKHFLNLWGEKKNQQFLKSLSTL